MIDLKAKMSLYFSKQTADRIRTEATARGLSHSDLVAEYLGRGDLLAEIRKIVREELDK
jgi:hypothetical protein